jgi:hypothetical protein
MRRGQRMGWGHFEEVGGDGCIDSGWVLSVQAPVGHPSGKPYKQKG